MNNEIVFSMIVLSSLSPYPIPVGPKDQFDQSKSTDFQLSGSSLCGMI